MEDDFDEETQRMLDEALAERDEGEDNGEDDSGIDDESLQSGAEDNSDGESKSEEDDSGDSGDGHEDEHQEGNEETSKLDFEPIEVEVGGLKVTINSKEEMLAYIKKGASSFNQRPESFQDEKLVIEQGQLSADDLKLLVDAKNGSKEAIAKLARMSNVDVLDLENEMADKYQQQKQYYKRSEVDQVAGEILQDTEHASEFQKIAKALPVDFMEAIIADAKDLKAFSGHIKSGIAQKVIPLAINSQMLNGGTFLENYNKVGYAMSQQTTQTQEKQKERTVSEREADLRKKASSGGGHNHQTKESSGKDIWEMSDEEFEKLDLSKLK